jgi:glycerophosphoryl diester phosphodiesterase
MVIIGHRGACGYEPENTLRSFRRALELGVDAVELDVYHCRSGELVVIHDETVDRTTNGRGYVVEMSLDQLRVLDAGKGEKVPTLAEVFDCVAGQCDVNIELKGSSTAEPVAELLAEYVARFGWQYSQFSVSSFNHIELMEFHRLQPEVATGALYDGIPLGYAAFAEPLGVRSVNLSLDFIDQKFVDDAHNRGLLVYVWTVNNETDVRRMLNFGVDGLFTNYPDLARRGLLG